MANPIAALLVILLASFAGCARHHRNRPYSTDGLKLTATALLDGKQQETLAVTILMNNSGREERYVEHSPGIERCGRTLRLEVRSPRNKRVVWDSEAYERAKRATQKEDTAAGGTRLLFGCIPSLMTRRLAPGASFPLTGYRVPVDAILGDSLPSGRYELRAKLFGTKGRGGYLKLGEIVLTRP
jgi:hypothetical protein